METQQLTLPLDVVPVALAPVRELIHDPYWDEIDNTEAGFIVLEPPPLLPVPEQKLGLHNTQYRCNHKFNVLERVNSDTWELAPEQHISQWIEIYSPSNRKYEYYRYCYRKQKIKRKHIPGGNIQSPIPNARKQIIEQAIKNGLSPREIEQIINNWSNKSLT